MTNQAVTSMIMKQVWSLYVKNILSVIILKCARFENTKPKMTDINWKFLIK